MIELVLCIVYIVSMRLGYIVGKIFCRCNDMDDTIIPWTAAILPPVAFILTYDITMDDIFYND